MSIDVAKELAVLEAMTLPELRVRYAGVLGEPSRSGCLDRTRSMLSSLALLVQWKVGGR